MARARPARSTAAGLRVKNEMMWCEKHLEPFKPRWPHGYLMATLALLDRALDRRDVKKQAGRFANRLGKVLEELGPMCCLVERDDPDGFEEMVRRALVMDPKLAQEIKDRVGQRRLAIWAAEREERDARLALKRKHKRDSST